MKHVHKSVLLWYSPREMYDLVTGIEDYPRFLPWCESAEVVARHDDGVTARLELSFAGVRQAFTTRNEQVPGETVRLSLVDGPFKQLDGTWAFRLVGDGEAAAQGCRIDFDMRYAFVKGPLGAALSPVFDRIAGTLVDSFVARAETVYGTR